jgi:peptidyl-prolyl cis-trans isomerase SurA
MISLPSVARFTDVRFLALAAILTVSSAACRPSPTTTTASKPVSPDTWAVVDGREITRSDVDKAYRRTRDASQAPSDEEVLAAKLNILNDLIIQDILMSKAAALKVEVPQTELDTAYANAKKNLNDDLFQQELSKRNLTAEDMREGLRREILANKVIEKEVNAKVSVTDKDVTDFFNANRAQFNLAEESYHIAQIVVTPVREPQVPNASGDDAATPEAAAAKVKLLMERLKAGTSFRELASAYSEDAESAARGGDMGFLPVSQLKQAPPQLRNAVLGKAPGTVNVASAGGGHTLVLVVAREPAGQRDLSTPGMKERITETLRGRKEQLVRMAYLISVRSDTPVQNYFARKVLESPSTAGK